MNEAPDTLNRTRGAWFALGFIAGYAGVPVLERLAYYVTIAALAARAFGVI